MNKNTFEEEKFYLATCAAEKLEHLIPFVVTDPNGLINIDEFIPYRTLTVDLAKTKFGDFENFVREFKAHFAKEEAEMIVFRNIDRISSRKDRDSWEKMVKKGLKGEDFDCTLNEGVLATIPFSQIKLVGTCSRYPDYLKTMGNLGIGPDFSNY